MSLSFDECVAVALAPDAVRVVGARAEPPAFGVYRLPHDAGRGRAYRFGRHPARANDLAREFGSAEVVHLFLQREQAETVARHLNALPTSMREREHETVRSTGPDGEAPPHASGRVDGTDAHDTSPAQDVQATMTANGGWVRADATGAARRVD